MPRADAPLFARQVFLWRPLPALQLKCQHSVIAGHWARQLWTSRAEARPRPKARLPHPQVWLPCGALPNAQKKTRVISNRTVVWFVLSWGGR